MTLTQKLNEMTLDALLIECVELAEGEKHMGIALIRWVGLPETPQTFAWFNLMRKRYGNEAVQGVVVSILESGTTLLDFAEDPRHFRSWFVATVRGRAENKDENGNSVSLDMFRKGA